MEYNFVHFSSNSIPATDSQTNINKLQPQSEVTFKHVILCMFHTLMHAYLFTGEKTVQQTIVELNTCGSIRAVCGSLYSVCPAGQTPASGSLHAAGTVSVGGASANI